MARHCPRCDTEYAADASVCWPCRVRLVDGAPNPAPERELVWVELRSVYRAPDEFTALVVQRVLADQDIKSWVRSGQIPWADGIMSNLTGYWGQVLVAPEDFEPARTLVAEYLRSVDGERGSEGVPPAP